MALYPANNKQDVNLALAIFLEITIAACKSYFPEIKDIASFLNLILTWWAISNSNVKYDSNHLGSAIARNDNKTEFFFKVQDGKQDLYCVNFCRNKQTSRALVLTLRSHAMLVKDLLEEWYAYIMTRIFKSDIIEKSFSQHRQKCSG